MNFEHFKIVKDKLKTINKDLDVINVFIEKNRKTLIIYDKEKDLYIKRQYRRLEKWRQNITPRITKNDINFDKQYRLENNKMNTNIDLTNIIPYKEDKNTFLNIIDKFIRKLFN